ncbi:PadR family transcriptional regulator [Nonomuraea sp. NPDC050202]|jgi:DNA-binding PadR family transcriptional regulator|uniref:PadR family transcriptional regulator n=1 Tax=Nonomuraea sp. NPDC050202 TaxID=3155035 RepID=UPI00340064D9
MSLRHALLAVLTAKPMTGYDLVKYFDGSVAFLWSAPHSQIYPELRRMERAGLVDAQVVPRGDKAEKRIYSISEAGVEELQTWLGTLAPYQGDRDPYRLRSAHFEMGTYASARRQLQEHRRHYLRALHEWEHLVDDIEAARVSLLRERLAKRPAAEHEAIIAFRSFAFRGEAAKARMEIAWAEEGLELLDRLEEKKVPLWGEQPDSPGLSEA